MSSDSNNSDLLFNTKLQSKIKNYNILNSITPKYYKKKAPYNIVQREIIPSIELTHKTLELNHIKGKNYFVTSDESKKYKKGGVYGGNSGAVLVFTT